MEEKRKDTAIEPAASTAGASATETLPKTSETSASEPTPARRRGGGQKRKLSNLSSGNTSTPPTASSSSKRQAREKPSAVPFPPIHNGPLTRARLQPNGAGSASTLDPASFSAAVKSEAELAAPPESNCGGAVKVEEESNAAKDDWDALEAKIEADYEVIRSRDGNAHVVPIPSGWFSWTNVHPLEERALPSFFNGKSKNRTPEIYMEIRNWIMNKFHTNPNSHFELKDLSELSVGELDARQEVMEFLDYWGLINYHPFPQIDSSSLSFDGAGAVKTGSLVEKLYHFEMEQSCTQVVPRTSVTAPSVTSRLFPESSSVSEELSRPEGPSVEYHCNSCSADCSRKRYHCQKEADFDLCTECFNSGKFGSYMSPSDFIIMEPADAAGASSGKWTDQETLLLLEALELYKENWNEIAEHVATKTKAQCILHFVQMPIEDTFLDCDDETGPSLRENADPVSSTIDDTAAPTDVPEAIESKDGASDNQSLSSTMEISKVEDTSKPTISPEIAENCALKALREAFEAVGSVPSPEGKLSFAEAGNPVMALAAFLVRLVEPDVLTASARSSMKSISVDASGMQLAMKHCFFLEDPPDDKKRAADSERDVGQTIEQEGQKDENQNDGKQKEEKSNSVLDNSDSTNDHDNGKNKDAVTEEKGLLVSPNSECTDISCAVKDSDEIVTHEEVEPALPNESDNPDLPKELEPSTAEESNDITSKVELLPNSAKEVGDGASAGGTSQSTEAPKDEEMVSDSLPSEKKEPEQLVTSYSMVENEANTGEEDTKDCKNDNEDPLETKSDTNIDQVKRAAVTAISAAAVKAKLLANQEEDQIRQLATLLIEKQLHKLETKLAFFTEMEGVVMRVREQLERSKQRLYHERAQIIAARLGISSSSSRPMQQPLPANRAAMAFSNSAPRPPMSMTSQRPPISRPIMASAPTSNLFAPATITGNSVQPSNQDKVSSVAMK